MFSPPKFAWYLAVLALLLAGCAPGAPTVIASYPRNIANQPRPAPTALDNSTRLSLQVDDVLAATDQAIDLTQQYGGWVIDRSCRGAGVDQIVNLVLAVPPANHARLRRALLGLGRIVDQDAWDDTGGCSTCADTSYIYLELYPSAQPWDAVPPAPGEESGNPAETFYRAWQVTAAIFTFLLNILIWIFVVVGPFVLIGLGILALVRRARHKPLSEK
jgi:hypothetical protein